jgi:ribosomal protein S18 acetylase RimI-like enzyme
MEVNIIRNKEEIYKFLIKSPEMQVYLIGDLDDFFWPKTIWYAARVNDKIKAIALLYTGMIPPTLLSFCKNDNHYASELLNTIKPLLPDKFQAHLSTGLLDIFGEENVMDYYGRNCKMALKKYPEEIYDKNIRQMTSSDLPEIMKLYSIAYPNNWFDKRMLETGKYLGYFSNEQLIGVAGIHVYSEEYKAAALGNIVTHPDYRGKQIAYKLTSALCNNLRKKVDFIGLNVKSDNTAAIKCYKKIGFETIGYYDECLIKNYNHAGISVPGKEDR